MCAAAEGLTLHKSDNTSGYMNVSYSKTASPYKAEVRRGGKRVTLGSFVTPEEAALCYARDVARNGAPNPTGVTMANMADEAPATCFCV